MRYYTTSTLLRATVIGFGALVAIGAARADESPALFFVQAAAGQEAVAAPATRRGHRVVHSVGYRIESTAGSHGDGRSLSGVSGALAAKAREIEGACGSTVISGRRHSYVAGTHRVSLHASGRAIDMKGNPGCIYAQLQGWPGGYSTDYGRVRHVHISLGGGEDGLRFAHGGGRMRFAHTGRWRYAALHNHRVAHS